MDTGTVINIARQTVWIIVKTAVPVLLVSMIVGLVISLFQTLTSIQEQTLTFVPKLIAILLTLMLLGAWMLNQITGFMGNLWNFKVGFAIALSVIVYAIHPDMSVEYDNMIDYCIIALQEVIVGVILGAASFFCVQIIQFSGKIIDMDIGISMAQLYDQVCTDFL